MASAYLMVVDHASRDSVIAPGDVQVLLSDIALVSANSGGILELDPQIGEGPVALLLVEAVVAGVAGRVEAPAFGGGRLVEDGGERDGDGLVVVYVEGEQLLFGLGELGNGVLDLQGEAEQEQREEDAERGGQQHAMEGGYHCGRRRCQSDGEGKGCSVVRERREVEGRGLWGLKHARAVGGHAGGGSGRQRA